MCVSTAPGVCVCVSTAPGVCVCVCVSTAPGVCVCVCVCTWMGQMQKTRFTAGYTLYNCVCDKKKISVIVFFQNQYPIMVQCLNIGKPIYRSISNFSI